MSDNSDTSLSVPRDLSRELISRVRGHLPPGDPVQQINAIVERPDAEGFIQAMEPDVLYRLIKGAGWDQGSDLVPYATAAQVQVFMDFDGWRRDRLVDARVDPWLEALVDDASDARLGKILRDMDPEFMALYFKRNLEVYEMVDGVIPDHAPDAAEASLDRVYAIVYPEDDERAALMRKLIDRLYTIDRALAWTLLEAVRWELETQMEEHAFRWRMSRLEEFGFVQRSEAMSVYRPLDPLRMREELEGADLSPLEIRSPQELDLPTIISSELSDEFLLTRVLHALGDAERTMARLKELTTLSNRTMIADGIEPGELGSGRQVLRRTLGYASLGLDFLARSDEDRAREVLERTPLRDLFRAGFSLTAQLQRRARQLLTRPTLTLVEAELYSLIDEGDAALVSALLRQRPTYAAGGQRFAEFKEQAQLDDAARRLGELAFKQLWTFGFQRMTVDQLVAIVYDNKTLNAPDQVKLDTLFASALGSWVIGERAEIRALRREDLTKLIRVAKQRPWGDTQDSILGHFAPMVDEVRPFLQGATSLFTGWLVETVRRIDDALVVLANPEDVRAVRALLLLHEE